MAAALAITTGRNRTTATLALTGGPATSAVTFSTVHPGGGTQRIPATTDGTGAATVTCVPSESGPLSVTVSAALPVVVVGPITATVG
jgi:hypothetical protein